jgi:hypothetical protein
MKIYTKDLPMLLTIAEAGLQIVPQIDTARLGRDELYLTMLSNIVSSVKGVEDVTKALLSENSQEVITTLSIYGLKNPAVNFVMLARESNPFLKKVIEISKRPLTNDETEKGYVEIEGEGEYNLEAFVQTVFIKLSDLKFTPAGEAPQSVDEPSVEQAEIVGEVEPSVVTEGEVVDNNNNVG